jgi:hypothetical protein
LDAGTLVGLFQSALDSNGENELHALNEMAKIISQLFRRLLHMKGMPRHTRYNCRDASRACCIHLHRRDRLWRTGRIDLYDMANCVIQSAHKGCKCPHNRDRQARIPFANH